MIEAAIVRSRLAAPTARPSRLLRWAEWPPSAPTVSQHRGPRPSGRSGGGASCAPLATPTPRCSTSCAQRLRPPRRRRPRLPRLHRRAASTPTRSSPSTSSCCGSSVFGNPHSLNPTSAAMTELVERARAAVLEFFRASPDEYVAIFTPNATGALRLVGEAYPFQRRRPLPAHLRQPQLGQRHPRVRARPRRRDHLRAERSRPTCASTSSCCPAT